MEDTFEVVKNPVIDESLAGILERGEVFEGLVNHPGWKLIISFYENSLRAFTNKAVKEGYKNMEEYNLERGRLLGISTLLGEIDNTLTILKNERAKTK